MLTKATVMVVDDEPRLRASLAELFAADGHRVIEAGDGDQALVLLRGGGELPDAIFLDLRMPVRDGISTLQAIMASGDSRAVPVVIVTSPTDRARLISPAERCPGQGPWREPRRRMLGRSTRTARRTVAPFTLRWGFWAR